MHPHPIASAKDFGFALIHSIQEATFMADKRKEKQLALTLSHCSEGGDQRMILKIAYYILYNFHKNTLHVLQFKIHLGKSYLKTETKCYIIEKLEGSDQKFYKNSPKAISILIF